MQKSTLLPTVCLLALLCGCASTQRVTRWANVVPTATRQQQVNPFVGKWVNADPETRGITKLAVGIVDHKIVVHMWGKCHPRDCYWGSVTAAVPQNSTDRLQVTWISTFKNEFQTLTLTDQRLTLQGKCFYTDDSGRHDREYLEQFVRGDFE